MVRGYIVGYAFFAFMMIQTYLFAPFYTFTTPEAIACGLLSGVGVVVSAIVVLFLYNGKRAERGRTFSKWFFYLFYPGHLLVLYFIKMYTAG